MTNGLKTKWAKIDKWAKRILTIAAVIGAMTPIYFWGKDVLEDKLFWYFSSTKEMIQQWQVNMGLFESLLHRVDDNEYFIVLSDGVKRDAIIFESNTGHTFLFVEDEFLGTIVYACYFNNIRGIWYFYSFEDNPYTLIYKK